MPTNFNLDADLAEARSRRDAIKRNLETLHRDAGGEELRGGDGERWENLARGLEGVEAEIESLEDERAERNARTDHLAKLAQNPGNLERAVPMPEPRDGSGDNPRMSRVRSDALRANERAEFMPERCRESMEQALRGDDDPEARMAQVVVATADRDYFRAFASWFRDPISGGHSWTEPERAAVRRVQHLERAMALGVTSTWTPEAIEQPDDSPALLQPAITCKKGAAFVPVSLELFEDSGIAQEVGALFADAKAVHEALSFTITQSNGPVGIITALVAAGGSTVIATGTNVLAQGDLYANQAALPARWRSNAKWMMNLSILNGYRQLPQATGLNYSVVDDSGPLPKALGWEVLENSSMDGALTGAAADYLVLSGDFQQFAIVDRLGTTIEVIPHLFGTNHRPTGQRGFYMHYRTGSDVLIPDAFRLSNFST